MSDKIRIGLAGCGVGQAHVAAFHQLPDRFEVLAVCDVDLSRARRLAEAQHVPRVCTDYSDLCRMDDVQVIDICTPSYLHVAQTLQALTAGKHVICEKPLAGSLAEVDVITTAAATAGKTVMPIFQNRFGHGLRQLKLLIERGVAGRAYLATAETAWRRRAGYYADGWHGRWQTELGGPLVTLGIHAHDVVYAVLGPARRLSALTTCLVNPIETEDCIAAALEMVDGSLCSLSVTTGSAQEITRHRFCFSNLSAESNAQPYRNTSASWIFKGDTPEIDVQIAEVLRDFQPLPEGFLGQFYRYAQAVQDGLPLPVTLADARAAVELITAIYLSARTGQIVELPLGSDHPAYNGWGPA
jgi:predicted dehydrogenase